MTWPDIGDFVIFQSETDETPVDAVVYRILVNPQDHGKPVFIGKNQAGQKIWGLIEDIWQINGVPV